MLRSAKYLLVGFSHVVTVAAVLKLLCFVSPAFLQCFFSNFVHLVVCLFIARYTFEFTKRKFLNQKIQPDGKAILVTGCDSGFGLYLARRLDSKGFHVFASCLFPSGPGAEELKSSCSKRLQILGLDVTKDDSVRDAVTVVKDSLGNLKLWGIVNNAGIQKGFSTDFASLQDFKDTVEVNSFGMVRVTKAFLPLLKQSRGRIVNLTSLNAKLAAQYNTPYCMSKFAAAGFSESLRLEMDVWGIRVIQIEPELFQTMIVDLDEVEKRLDSEVASVEQELRDEYGEKYFENLKRSMKILLKNYTSAKVNKVVDDLESAISSEYPDIIYRPSRSDFIRITLSLIELCPYAVRDLIAKIGCYSLSFPVPLKA